ncbi:MAG TPA: hypothetical protein VEP67_11995 [Thiobacillaceae bacterium]|nr:hypothetical protein [Thiobacillaceae bacterium]
MSAMPATSWFIQNGTRVMSTMTATAIAFPIDCNTLFLFRQERVAWIRNRSPDASETPAQPSPLRGSHTSSIKNYAVTGRERKRQKAHRKSLSCFLRIL